MTAEIAIINKAAVVLAADSAVTITVGGSEKIYNSVNKIFDLGMGCPLGIMIYGNLDYMGIPFETLVKVYRKERALCHFPTVDEAFSDLLDYLKEYELSEKDEDLNVTKILDSNFQVVQDEFFRQLRSSAATTAFTTQVNKILSEQIARKLRLMRGQKRAFGFTSIDETIVLSKYKSIYDEVIQQKFRGLKLYKNTTLGLRDLAKAFLIRSVMSPNRNGLVMAGFGSTQVFPSLRAVEIDGIVLGKLKFQSIEKLTIERMGKVQAGILPFAQKEMVERFLKGVDPDFELYSFHQFTVLLQAVGKKLIDENSVSDQNIKKELIARFDEFARSTLKELRQKTDDYKEKAFRQKFWTWCYSCRNKSLSTWQSL